MKTFVLAGNLQILFEICDKHSKNRQILKDFGFVAILFCAITSCSTVREKPRPATSTGKEAKREFRGAWIQTAFQGEYKDMTPPG